MCIKREQLSKSQQSLLLLIGALAVVYDHYAIYRSNVGLSIKAFKLFKAWTVTFCFLVAMAFLTKQSEQYSRLLVGELFIISLCWFGLLAWSLSTDRAQRLLLRVQRPLNLVTGVLFAVVSLSILASMGAELVA